MQMHVHPRANTRPPQHNHSKTRDCTTCIYSTCQDRRSKIYVYAPSRIHPDFHMNPEDYTKSPSACTLNISICVPWNVARGVLIRSWILDAGTQSLDQVGQDWVWVWVQVWVWDWDGETRDINIDMTKCLQSLERGDWCTYSKPRRIVGLMIHALDTRLHACSHGICGMLPRNGHRDGTQRNVMIGVG